MPTSRTSAPAGPAEGVAAVGAGDAAAAGAGEPVEARQLRSDARANRQRLLKAAEEVFAVEGVAAPIAEVARHAGVGMGTVYRHFPTKEALFEAIVEEHLSVLVEGAGRLVESGDPAKALDEFLGEFAGAITGKRDLADALERAGIDFKARFTPLLERLQASVAVLLGRAQAAGYMRTDVTCDELFALVQGACMAAEKHGGDAATTQRMLGIVCDGLRTSSR
jgi:AcrR family transcriptional regulator